MTDKNYLWQGYIAGFWQLEIEACSLACLCVEANVAVMFFDYGFRDRQPQPGTTMLALIGSIRLGKFVKYPGLELRDNARPMIANCHTQILLNRFDTHLNIRLWWGEFGGVGEQVTHYLMNTVRVYLHPVVNVRWDKPEMNLMLFGIRMVFLNGHPYQ